MKFCIFIFSSENFHQCVIMDKEVIHLNENDVKNLQFDCKETGIDLERVKKELKLQNDAQWTSHCLVYSDEEANCKYTPMQFGSKYGLVEMVKLLLENNIDPNFKENKETKKHKRQSIRFVRRQNSIGIKDTEDGLGTKENCDEYPLILAAKNGHHEILKLFKYHNFSDTPKDATELVQHKVATNEDIELQNLFLIMCYLFLSIYKKVEASSAEKKEENSEESQKRN